MLSQRILQQTARRFAARQPAVLTRSKLLAPSLTSSRNASISAPGAEQRSQADGQQILANQRLHRPVAPHLTIYRPQVTWILSGLNRITGVIVSGAIYLFGITYAAAPLLGYKITAAGMAAGFAKWPAILQFFTKMTLSLPFTFHSLNGFRHLIWDTGSMINNPMVQKTGWAVVGLTAVSSLGLALFL